MNHDVTLTSSLPFYTPEFDLDAGENTADTTEAEAEAERDGAGSSCQLFTSCTELVGSQEQDEIYIRSVAMIFIYIYTSSDSPANPPFFFSLSRRSRTMPADRHYDTNSHIYRYIYIYREREREREYMYNNIDILYNVQLQFLANKVGGF